LTGAKGSSAADGSSCSFQIKEIASQNESEGINKTWLATAKRLDKVATFRIQLLLKKHHGGVPFAFSSGALLREADSDGAWFLKEIAQALAAKTIPTRADFCDRLEIATAVLGTALSRGGGGDRFAGSFTSQPAGDWLAVKVFVADGGGEFFLNLNSAAGLGEIALKDEGYGDTVVEELARILLPKNLDAQR